MPICPRCGKNLCNQQSLDYHLQSARCSAKHSNLIKTPNIPHFDISFTCDLKGVITEISNESAQVLGYVSSELIGQSMYITTYEMDKFYATQFHISMLISKVSDVYCLRRITKDDIIIPMKTYACINMNENKIIVYDNIIKFSNANSGNVIVNLDGYICHMNSKYTEYFGYTSTDCIKDYDTWHPQDKQKFIDSNVKLNIAKQVNIKYRKKCKNNSYICVAGFANHRGNFIMISELLIQ